jgi:hypothetical protein
MTVSPTPQEDEIADLPILPPGKEWPQYMLAKGAGRLRATYARIAYSAAADQEFVRERAAALEWCRANGNPHLALMKDHTDDGG